MELLDSEGNEADKEPRSSTHAEKLITFFYYKQNREQSQLPWRLNEQGH